MPTLIDRQGRREDGWVAPGEGHAPAPGARVLLPLATWTADRERWIAHGGPLGVLLGPADDPDALAGDLGRLGLIAVAFPSFADGRGYSIARLVRERLGWRGELRAVGDVLRDQVQLMARCGFDTFALRDDQDVEDVLAAFSDFSEAYQAANDRPALFERLRRAHGPVDRGPAGA